MAILNEVPWIVNLWWNRNMFLNLPKHPQTLCLAEGAWQAWWRCWMSRTETWPGIFGSSWFLKGLMSGGRLNVQAWNFVAMSLYQHFPKEIKIVNSVHEDKRLTFTSSVSFPIFYRFHWGGCGALWWCWRAGIKGWQGDFSGIGEGGFWDWLLKGLECHFVAVVFENPCRSM